METRAFDLSVSTYGVFSPAMIDGIIAQLKAYKDKTLRKDIEKKPKEIQKQVETYFHCG